VTKRWAVAALAAVIGCAPAWPAGGADGESDGGENAKACQRVPIVDAQSGEPVVGAEDFVVDRVADQIYLAAYNRWALADAVDGGADALPQGAIYAAPLRSLARQPDRLPLRRLADGGERDFHPHGLAIYRDGDTARLHAINHAYARPDGAWTRTSVIETFAITPDGLTHRRTAKADGLCRANNLTALSARDLLITRDHGACDGLGRWLEDILGLDRGQVLLGTLGADGGIRLDTLVDDVGFANGIAVSPDGATVAVAATRDEHVRFYATPQLISGGGDALKTIVQVDGGPDNLAWSADGRLIAAVHPSLFFAGLARHRWFGFQRAGSKAIAVNPTDAVTATLFHDTSGKLLNAGTAGALVDGTLILSAVLDSALVVCRR
jgi:arylesterase/paraoxonase